MGGRALVRRVVLQLVGGLPRSPQEGIEPAPVEGQDQEDQEPPADLNTGTRPYNEGGNLTLRASSRGRGNGLANQMPDQASHEVQGKIRYLTLARGGSRVVYTLDREPRWVLKVGPQDAHHFEWELFALSLDSWPQVCRRFTDGGPHPPNTGRFVPPDVHYVVLLVRTTPSGGVLPSPRSRGA